MTSFRRHIVLGLAFVAGLGACRSRLTGNEGNLEFSYLADDRLFDFNKPLGIGARLDIDVAEVGSGRPVTLSSARIEQPSMQVARFDGNRVIVEALEEGNGFLRVDARTSQGDMLSDTINLTARSVEVVKLGHSCVDGRNARYLSGQRILIPFELERNDGQSVIGYGLYPVTFSPSNLSELDRSIKAQQFLHIDTLGTGTVALTSDVDDEVLDVTLVDPNVIDGAEIVLGEIQETDVGDTNLYYILPTVNGDRVCQAKTPKNVETNTPDICEVTDREPPANDQQENGWIAVRGISQGTCRFVANYPAGRGGAGATAQLEIAIAP